MDLSFILHAKIDNNRLINKQFYLFSISFSSFPSPYLLPGLFEFGTEGDGFLIVFHGRLLHVMLQAFVTHKDVFAGVLHGRAFSFSNAACFSARFSALQTVDDVQLPADEALHVGLLDVVAGMDGFEKLIQESAEVPFVEGFGGGNVLNVCLCLLQGTVDGGAVVEAFGEADNLRTHEYIGTADGLFQLDAFQRGAAAEGYVCLPTGKHAAGKVDDYPAEGQSLGSCGR